MSGALIAAVIVVCLWALHRLALWMESRGWIYYRKSRGRSGSAANAFLEVQSLLEPGKRHLLEERMRDEDEEDESGDPPE